MQFTLTVNRSLFTPCSNRIAGVLDHFGFMAPMMPPGVIEAIMADYLYVVYSRTVAPPDVGYLLMEHLLRQYPASIPSPIVHQTADQIAGPLAELSIRIQPFLTRVVEDLEMAGEEIIELTLVTNATSQQMLVVVDIDPVDDNWGGHRGNVMSIHSQRGTVPDVICGLL